jgi:hypothetical protein
MRTRWFLVQGQLLPRSTGLGQPHFGTSEARARSADPDPAFLQKFQRQQCALRCLPIVKARSRFRALLPTGLGPTWRRSGVTTRKEVDNPVFPQESVKMTRGGTPWARPFCLVILILVMFSATARATVVPLDVGE